MRSISIICLLVLSLLLPTAKAEEISVAVASNFTAPMKEIASLFEQSTGHKVRLSFGSSGKFYAQIKHGAPFQVFFSADQKKPEQLERDRLIAPSSRFTYARGRLALWSSQKGFVKGNAERLKQLQFNKLALANPKLAPYGVAAIEVLERLSLIEATQNKWVQGENIAQTYQFVSTGNAELGFVALSQILKDGKLKTGSSWVIPENLYNPIKQDVVLLLRGENSPAAQALLTFIKEPQVKQIMTSYGYKPLAANP